MRERVLAYLCGFLFALGLGVAGMTQPGKITAFLDVTGAWDPSLLLVMLGAIAVYAIGYRLVRRRPRPVCAEAFHVPTTDRIDRPLALGATLFGIGWGLAGYCPGPAIVAVVALRREPLVFTAAMLVGMAVFEARSFSQNPPGGPR